MTSEKRYARDLRRGLQLQEAGPRRSRNLVRPTSNRSFTVDKITKSRHTANAVLKQAGLDKQF